MCLTSIASLIQSKFGANFVVLSSDGLKVEDSRSSSTQGKLAI